MLRVSVMWCMFCISKVGCMVVLLCLKILVRCIGELVWCVILLVLRCLKGLMLSCL